MIAWLTARSLFGLARGWVVLAVIAAATALGLWLSSAEKADDRGNQQLGAAVQREADLRTTLDRTEKANAAREEVRTADSSARYDQCLRTARTPGNCQRFMPGGQTHQR